MALKGPLLRHQHRRLLLAAVPILVLVLLVVAACHFSPRHKASASSFAPVATQPAAPPSIRQVPVPETFTAPAAEAPAPTNHEVMTCVTTEWARPWAKRHHASVRTALRHAHHLRLGAQVALGDTTVTLQKGDTVWGQCAQLLRASAQAEQAKALQLAERDGFVRGSALQRLADQKVVADRDARIAAARALTRHERAWGRGWAFAFFAALAVLGGGAVALWARYLAAKQDAANAAGRAQDAEERARNAQEDLDIERRRQQGHAQGGHVPPREGPAGDE